MIQFAPDGAQRTSRRRVCRRDGWRRRLTPGSSGNGQYVGYSIGGGADSENRYLVEGQDTENVSGGISAANVPFQFIQEMQVKSSGIEAEYGGALGGVINVIMKKGSNAFHGSVFGSWEGSGVDGSWNRNYAMFPSPPVAGLRYDPLAGGAGEPDTQTYIPQKGPLQHRSAWLYRWWPGHEGPLVVLPGFCATVQRHP